MPACKNPTKYYIHAERYIWIYSPVQPPAPFDQMKDHISQFMYWTSRPENGEVARFKMKPISYKEAVEFATTRGYI